MKKFVLLLCLLAGLYSQAQFTGPGYYRVHNAYSNAYISIKGTHYERTTKPDAFWSCILMLQDSAQINDPGSIIYIPGLQETSLYSQGVSTYSLTGLWMEVDTAKAREGGLDTYIATTTAMINDRPFKCYFRDDGYGLTAGSGDRTETRWWIEPVNELSLDASFLGVLPAGGQDGEYWATMCCDFPFLLPPGGGIEGAYTVKEVKQGNDGNYYAAPIKICSQGEVVPAATPVLLKCAKGYAGGNKIVPTGDIANNTVFPLVSDLLHGTYYSVFTNRCNTQDLDQFKEYVPDQAIAATATNLALGMDEQGRMGFFPQQEGTYMAANTAWLAISGQELDGMTAVLLGEAPAPEIQKGDVNGDGVVSIKDVTMLIDYLLGGDGNVTFASVNMAGADVNGDGVISIKDVTMLIDMLLDGSEQ